MNNDKPSILLIDDNEANLKKLVDRLSRRLPDVTLKPWCPTEEEGPPEAVFKALTGGRTVLVVTDYDLTTGVKGLFGHSIVGWCQSRSIPVGDFSRANIAALPKEPNLFELRVPIDEEEGAAFIANAFQGFRSIREKIANNPRLLTERRSLAAVLSALLGRPQLESHFAAYMSRVGASNSALLQRLRDFAGAEAQPGDQEKTRLLAYVLGHVLLNAVLKYPGPILSGEVLCAYLATTPDEIDPLTDLFKDAKYAGPFSNGAPLFWRDDVDSILDKLAAGIADDQFESFGDFNRGVAVAALNRNLIPHSCVRCDGMKGGFWCPFTMRPVCERTDCSVPSSSWIPSGAQLCRVERDFYDEWAPILGF